MAQALDAGLEVRPRGDRTRLVLQEAQGPGLGALLTQPLGDALDAPAGRGVPGGSAGAAGDHGQALGGMVEGDDVAVVVEGRLGNAPGVLGGEGNPGLEARGPLVGEPADPPADEGGKLRRRRRELGALLHAGQGLVGGSAQLLPLSALEVEQAAGAGTAAELQSWIDADEGVTGEAQGPLDRLQEAGTVTCRTQGEVGADRRGAVGGPARPDEAVPVRFRGAGLTEGCVHGSSRRMGEKKTGLRVVGGPFLVGAGSVACARPRVTTRAAGTTSATARTPAGAGSRRGLRSCGAEGSCSKANPTRGGSQVSPSR